LVSLDTFVQWSRRRASASLRPKPFGEALAAWIALHNRDLEMALYPDWVANQSWLMFGFPGV